VLKPTRLDTGTRKSVARIKAHPDIGSVRAGGGVANDLFTPDQGNRCSGGTSGDAGVLQHLFEAKFCAHIVGDEVSQFV
jgi:hypothetical protein